MKNIFKNACFGKAYKTRDGRKAIYIKEKLVHESLSHTDVLYAQLVLETGDILEVVKEIGVSNGTQLIYDNLDIVSEWYEEISEEKLDELATKNTITNLGYDFDPHDYTDHYGKNAHWASYKEGWKDAYRKALEL